MHESPVEDWDTPQNPPLRSSSASISAPLCFGRYPRKLLVLHLSGSMTPIGAASRLELSAQGDAALAELCEKGCDLGTLLALVIWLTALPMRLQPRAMSLGPDSLQRTSGSGLEITAGFTHPPEQARPGPAGSATAQWVALMQDSFASQHDQAAERGERSFKSRDLKVLREQLKRAAAEIRELFEGSVARQASQRRGSPALTLTLISAGAKLDQ